MKINKKLIGFGIASLGAMMSIGGAFALYTQSAENVSFGISAGTYAGSGGSVVYKINGAGGTSEVAPSYLTTVGENGGTGLSATYTQVEYQMALSATYAGNNLQNYVVGKLSISITDIPAAYQGKLAIWAVIDGYEAASLGEHYYKNAFMNEDFQITDQEGHTSFSGSHDVAVSSNGAQTLKIYMKYNLAGIDTLGQNEASLGYNLSVRWEEPSNEFNPAYVKCDANQWEEDDGFAMLPNINKAHAEGWEWIYNNYPGSDGETKCFISDRWSQTNFVPDAEKSYNITWNGNDGAAANYQEIA